MVYLAHSPTESHPNGQLLKDHLRNVSDLAYKYGKKINIGEECRYVGMIHDIGKYSDSFQRRILGATETVDHSTAGAFEASLKQDFPAMFAIAGHHSGLPDLGSPQTPDDGGLLGRIGKAKAKEIPDYSIFSKEIQVPNCKPVIKENLTDLYFLTQSLFSCLVDADWTDTGNYFDEEPEPKFDSLPTLLEKLNIFFNGFKNDNREINIIRNTIKESVLEKSEEKKGLFSLTVPTGGGKTLTSVAFALKHAIKNSAERIVYIIPYCSILEQTGKIFRKIFGEQNVTLNYSTAEIENDDKNPNAFVSEKWDAPIILTTAVQFFESIYSNKPSRSRKVHNACNSVLIFDEAQMLPVYYLKPCVLAICQMVREYGCTAILCTATQPSLDKIINEFLPNIEIEELCDPRLASAAVFNRVGYIFDGELSNDALSRIIREKEQILCIVNNRKQAQDIFETIETADSFCLTTLLCSKDRKIMLDEIRERLSHGRPCRVISTSLIEAGVDVDFPSVYKAISGIDSIVQAGGRCNREGKKLLRDSSVHIFIPEANPPRGIEQNIAVTKKVIAENAANICSSKAVDEYFKLLFLLKGDALDNHKILENINKLNFATVSHNFKLIDGQNDFQIYIRGIGGDEFIDKLKTGSVSRQTLREAAKFAVSVSKRTLDEFLSAGKAIRILKNGAELTEPDCYDRRTGLKQNFSAKADFC